jgi:hypothetical protein
MCEATTFLDESSSKVDGCSIGESMHSLTRREFAAVVAAATATPLFSLARGAAQNGKAGINQPSDTFWADCPD